MESFTNNLKYEVLCYAARGHSTGRDTCNAKEGNPFGPFWNRFNIDFDNSEFFGPLSYDPSFDTGENDWAHRFPPSKYPVLAFSGAPGAFPVLEKHVHLQQYLKWSDLIVKQADAFLNGFKEQADAPFIAIHLRNGQDFVRWI